MCKNNWQNAIRVGKSTKRSASTRYVWYKYKKCRKNFWLLAMESIRLRALVHVHGATKIMTMNIPLSSTFTYTYLDALFSTKFQSKCVFPAWRTQNWVHPLIKGICAIKIASFCSYGIATIIALVLLLKWKLWWIFCKIFFYQK